MYLPHADALGSLLTANLKRIEAIEEMTVTSDETMAAGVLLRGAHIRLKVRLDHFAGTGDLYLFGCALHRFLEDYASINTCTRQTVDEPMRGESYQWLMRQEVHDS